MRFLAILTAVLILFGTRSAWAVPGDLIYTFDVTDGTSQLTSNGNFATVINGSVSGGLGDISPGTSTQDIGNVFEATFTGFGAYGIDTNDGVKSVWVGFSDGGSAANGVDFDTFFAPFFAQYSDLTVNECTIADALEDASITDNETGVESGVVLYQFRDYLETLSDTTATIDTGTLTLVHFGDGTLFGTATAFQAVPETSNWVLGLMLSGILAVWRLRRCRSSL